MSAVGGEVVTAQDERVLNPEFRGFKGFPAKAGLVAVLALGAVLAACGPGGPENQDIEDWLFKDRPVDQPNIANVVIETSDCRLMEHGQAYGCDVKFHYTYKDGAPQSAQQHRTVGFAKTAGRWARTFNEPYKDQKDGPK